MTLGLSRLGRLTSMAGLLVAAFGPQPMTANGRRIEPKWFRFHLEDFALGLDVESEFQTRSSPLVLGSDEYKRLYVAPLLEFQCDGSIYHSNLFEFDLFGEYSYAHYRYTRTVAGGDGDSTIVVDYNPTLFRFNFSGVLLKEKPYSVRVHASQGQTTRNQDFYTSVRIDSKSYGIGTGYRSGPVPFEVGYEYLTETQTGLNIPSAREESRVTLSAYNDRGETSRTEFDYTYSEFDRRNLGLQRDVGWTQLATLADTERFGSSEQMRLRANARYSRTGSTSRDDEAFQARANLDVEHTDSIDSDYSYSYNQRVSGLSVNSGHHLKAGVSHQWYESLTSSLETNLDRDLSTSPDGGLEVRRYGFTWTERYKKQLTDQSILSLGYTLRVQPESRVFKGDDFVVLGEPHILLDGTPTLLDIPYVRLQTVKISDSTGSFLYDQGFDYTLHLQGVFTEIRRVPGGRIANGQAVLADYVAEPQPSGQFISTIHSFTWRFDLWERKLSLYGRFARDSKSGDSEVIVNEYQAFMIGVESDLDWLQVGAEYEDFDSTLTPFTSIRLFQRLRWDARSSFSVSLNMSQARTDYPDTERRVDYFDWNARAEIAPSRNLECSIEAGYRIEQGDGVDQAMITARLFFDYQVGRMSVQTGYDFQYRSYFSDTFGRHFLYLHGRRSF